MNLIESEHLLFPDGSGWSCDGSSRTRCSRSSGGSIYGHASRRRSMNDSPLKTSGNGYSVLCSRWPYAQSCIQKINKGIINGVVQSLPTCTDVDAPDDDEDDEGAIAVVDETSVLHTNLTICSTPSITDIAESLPKTNFGSCSKN